MIVRFSMSSTLISGAFDCSDAGPFSEDCEVGHAEGCDVAASNPAPSDGVCVPDVGLETGLEGAREGTVWLSRVKRRDVMMT